MKDFKPNLHVIKFEKFRCIKCGVPLTGARRFTKICILCEREAQDKLDKLINNLTI